MIDGGGSMPSPLLPHCHQVMPNARRQGHHGCRRYSTAGTMVSIRFHFLFPPYHELSLYLAEISSLRQELVGLEALSVEMSKRLKALKARAERDGYERGLGGRAWKVVGCAVGAWCVWRVCGVSTFTTSRRWFAQKSSSQR